MSIKQWKLFLMMFMAQLKIFLRMITTSLLPNFLRNMKMAVLTDKVNIAVNPSQPATLCCEVPITFIVPATHSDINLMISKISFTLSQGTPRLKELFETPSPFNA